VKPQHKDVVTGIQAEKHPSFNMFLTREVSHFIYPFDNK
jgi:hypothetical protein